jgi:hypothetical protein
MRASELYLENTFYRRHILSRRTHSIDDVLYLAIPAATAASVTMNSIRRTEHILPREAHSI